MILKFRSKDVEDSMYLYVELQRLLGTEVEYSGGCGVIDNVSLSSVEGHNVVLLEIKE